MPVHTRRLTDTAARSIAPPPAGYALHWCPGTPGFGLRVTSTGAKAWVAERRVDGQTVRRTLGKATGAAAITAEAARRLQVDVSSELQQGTDRLEVKRERRKVEKVEAITFEAALHDYVKGKRRAKDGLALKARTVADYLAMLTSPRVTIEGRETQGGELHSIAGKSLARLTAENIRDLHKALASRGERRQTYAMQVLRAVLRHHGINVEGNPLSPTTAGALRVHLAPSRGNPSPIPPERLGQWWQAATAIDSTSADQLRFMLLTGCRPGEAAGLRVADVDLVGKRVVLRDTKNRSDHVIVLSRQAAAIVAASAAGERPDTLLFGVVDTGKTIAAINAAAEVRGVTAHKLRHTFASIAAELLPAFTLRRLLNHTSGGDVAATHYVHVSEEQLRAGWQAVADFIELSSGKCS